MQSRLLKPTETCQRHHSFQTPVYSSVHFKLVLSLDVHLGIHFWKIRNVVTPEGIVRGLKEKKHNTQ